MPVRKYHRVEDMPGPTWHPPGDPALGRAMRAAWGLAHRTIRPRFPPGVHRSRSFDEMCAQQDAWDDSNFLAYHARLRRQGGACVAPHEARLLAGQDASGLNGLTDELEIEAALRKVR